MNHFQHQAEYEEILAGVKGADNCKRLSSQFIARFFGYFPSLMDQSIDAMLDLCEDGNVDIRKQVGGDLMHCREKRGRIFIASLTWKWARLIAVFIVTGN